MWQPEDVDLTPEPWHRPVPGLAPHEDDQSQYWNAPDADEFARMMGEARKLWAEGYRYGDERPASERGSET